MSHDYLPAWKAQRGYYELDPQFRWLDDEECDYFEEQKKQHARLLALLLPRSEDAWRRLFGLLPPEQKQKLDKDRVKERVDMLDLAVRHGAHVRSHGTRATGKCPFHDDRLASFSLDLVRKLWHCFSGCGGGDCFSFVMRVEECTFFEAVRILNQEY